MSPTDQQEAIAASTSDESLKLAVAISLLRAKLVPQNHSDASDSDALRWKRKAKERKLEISRLREDLKEAEDVSHCDLFPQNAVCKCYFFDNLGQFSPARVEDVSDQRFNDVLRRRFLRQVRFRERKRRGDPVKRLRFSDLNSGDEVEVLKASVDFIVELCDTVKDANFTNWSHQAVDFILASTRSLLSAGKNIEPVEGIVNCLIVRLIRRMCTPSRDELQHNDYDVQFFVQHLIRKLGFESYIGQRALLSVSQRISVLAESLLFSDPFDDTFLNLNRIQLIDFLISDYLLTWSKEEAFDNRLFEEWVVSVLHARKALELLENRNGLYVLYMDRVIGQLAKGVGNVSQLQKLSPDILTNLFHQQLCYILQITSVNLGLTKCDLQISSCKRILGTPQPLSHAGLGFYFEAIIVQYTFLISFLALPSCARKDRAMAQLLRSHSQPLQTRKLAIQIKKVKGGRYVPTGSRGKTSSAIGVRVSSLHVWSIFCYSLVGIFML